MAFKDDKDTFPAFTSMDKAYPFMGLFPFSVFQVIVLLVHIEERCTHCIRDALVAGNGTGIKPESASLWVGKKGYS
jgi:hypothetical protein